MTGRPSSGLRADARRNREAILNAADRAFAEEGLGVPVDEIARRAGVGAGTLYRHFPTKEVLFEAVLVDHLRRLAERGRELAEEPDAGQALFEFMGCLADEATAKRSLIDALAGAGVDVQESAADVKSAVQSAFENLLARAQAQGGIRPDVTTADLFALIMGTCAMADHAAPDSQARVLAVVRDGLRAQKSSAS